MDFRQQMLTPFQAALAPLMLADAPGAVARGMISGQSLPEAFGSVMADPTSMEGRVYGEDITGDPLSGFLMELLTDPTVLLGLGAGGLGAVLGRRYMKSAAGGAPGEVIESILRRRARGEVVPDDALELALARAEETVSRETPAMQVGDVSQPVPEDMKEMHYRLIDRLVEEAERDPSQMLSPDELYAPSSIIEEMTEAEAQTLRQRPATQIERALYPEGEGFASSEFISKLLGPTQESPLGDATVEAKGYLLPYLKGLVEGTKEDIPITDILEGYSESLAKYKRQVHRGVGRSGGESELIKDHDRDIWYDVIGEDFFKNWGGRHGGASEYVGHEDLDAFIQEQWTSSDWADVIQRMMAEDINEEVFLEALAGRGWNIDEIMHEAGIGLPKLPSGSTGPRVIAKELSEQLLSPEVAEDLSKAGITLDDLVTDKSSKVIGVDVAGEQVLVSPAGEDIAAEMAPRVQAALAPFHTPKGHDYVALNLNVGGDIDFTVEDWLHILNLYLNQSADGTIPRPGQLTYLVGPPNAAPGRKAVTASMSPDSLTPERLQWEGWQAGRVPEQPGVVGGVQYTESPVMGIRGELGGAPEEIIMQRLLKEGDVSGWDVGPKHPRWQTPRGENMSYESHSRSSDVDVVLPDGTAVKSRHISEFQSGETYERLRKGEKSPTLQSTEPEYQRGALQVISHLLEDAESQGVSISGARAMYETTGTAMKTGRHWYGETGEGRKSGQIEKFIKRITGVSSEEAATPQTRMGSVIGGKEKVKFFRLRNPDGTWVNKKVAALMEILKKGIPIVPVALPVMMAAQQRQTGYEE
mgnify:CR=1 FL=1